MQGSRTVEPFIASIEDTFPVDTSSPPTLHTPGQRKREKEGLRKRQTGHNNTENFAFDKL